MLFQTRKTFVHHWNTNEDIFWLNLRAVSLLTGFHVIKTCQPRNVSKNIVKIVQVTTVALRGPQRRKLKVEESRYFWGGCTQKVFSFWLSHCSYFYGPASFNNIEAYGGVRQHSDLIQNIFIFCSEYERKSYGVETIWLWVITDRIFIFGWTNPLIIMSVLKG